MEKEWIEIVDEEGNYTGQVIEKEEAHDKNLLHNEVAVFVINNNYQVLLQKRNPHKRFNPNKWALCAGHVDAKESLEDAALRELKEEIGVEFSKKELIPFAKREFSIQDTNSHITYFYYVKCNKKDSEFVIQKEELSEVKWFSFDEIIDRIERKDNTIVFHENRLYLFETLKNL